MRGEGMCKTPFDGISDRYLNLCGVQSSRLRFVAQLKRKPRTTCSGFWTPKPEKLRSKAAYHSTMCLWIASQ